MCDAFGEKQICCIYQKSLHNLELWLYNIRTQQIEKALWSVYNPANVQFCSDGTRFSFIDNGRVRVYSFLKRSARSLEFTEPLHDVTFVEWADNNHCYFSAKQHGHYAILQTDMDGDIAHILSAYDADYLYPQKVGNQLFVVKRVYLNTGYRYQIIKVAYKSTKKRKTDAATDLFGTIGDVDLIQEDILTDSVFEDIQDQKKEYVILSTGTQVVAFLSMVSSAKGFFARFKVPIDQRTNMVELSYHGIYKNGKLWRSNKLFSFSVPTGLISGPDRLHESLLPLLPRYFDNLLYYASSSSNCDMTLYQYNLSTGQIKWIGCPDSTCFAPLMHKGRLFYGIAIEGEIDQKLLDSISL